jgi:hypothetical protein
MLLEVALCLVYIVDEPGKTNMWHMRFGHMSEHGMVELHRRNLLDGCNLSKLEFYEHCIFGKHKRVKFSVFFIPLKEF